MGVQPVSLSDVPISFVSFPDYLLCLFFFSRPVVLYTHTGGRGRYGEMGTFVVVTTGVLLASSGCGPTMPRMVPQRMIGPKWQQLNPILDQ